MKRVRCPRSLQVQAALDGRLDAASRAASLGHLEVCPSCQAEQLADGEIRARIEHVVHDTNDVALRRLRQRVLAQSSQLRTPRTLRWQLPVAVGALALGLVVWSLRAPAPSVRVQPVVVTAERDARWTRRVASGVEHVELSSGTLLFHVARQPTDPRLVVRVPDGEIEDLGTTFSVSVSQGRTQEIAVHEGRVLFHRRGSEDLQLLAGSTWRAAQPEPAHSAAPPVSAVEPAATVKPKARRGHARVVSEPASEPAPPFAASSEEEDAAYLHILALLHEQRGDEARLAAFAYLRAFPNGLKVREVREVAEAYGKEQADAGA